MNKQQTIKHGGMLGGAVALLLISAALNHQAWAITGGEPDAGRHPNVCAVLAAHPVYGLLPFSGTLIHPRVILTAGHAVAMIEAGQATLYGVSFEQNVNLMDTSTWLEVTGTACYYSRFDLQKVGANPANGDIALLILKEPVTSVTPAIIPTEGFLDELKRVEQLQSGPNGTMLTVVGYGFGLQFPPPLPVFPISEEAIVPRNAAQSGYLGLNPGWLIMNQNPAAGYGGTALGDSGGPAFWTNPETGDEVLVGITSWGCTLVGSGFYYRIDAAEPLQFIHDAIESLEPK